MDSNCTIIAGWIEAPHDELVGTCKSRLLMCCKVSGMRSQSVARCVQQDMRSLLA